MSLLLPARTCKLQYVYAQRAGEIASAARAIDTGDEGGERDIVATRLFFQRRPEFGFERDTGAMAGDGEGALFEHDGLGVIAV